MRCGALRRRTCALRRAFQPREREDGSARTDGHMDGHADVRTDRWIGFMDGWPRHAKAVQADPSLKAPPSLEL